jgi:TonB family protein
LLKSITKTQLPAAAVGSGKMAGMQRPKTISNRVALAVSAALVLTSACGEVTGPADSPEPTTAPEDDVDLGEITDGEIEGGDAKGGGDTAPEEGEQAGDDSGEEASAEGGGDAEGSRDLTVIAQLVKQHRDPVRDCYEKARKKNPKLQGKMVIHFELDPEGKVTSAKLNEGRSEISDPDLVACAIKVIKGIPFPASSKGMVTEVNYPYNFKP